MFAGVSKLKLSIWAVVFALFTVGCWSTDTVITRVIALVFLIVAVVLFFALKGKIDRDAHYRDVSQMPTVPMYPRGEPKPSSQSNYFGPPPSLDK
jgi:hypothetical protein